MAVSWGRLVSLLALSSGAIAQTYTSCNPTTNSSCPSDTGLSSSSYSVDFTQGEDSDNWTSVGTGSITYSSSGAAFIISKKGDAPTLDTNWYFFFGRAEVHMRASGGTGIVSSVVLESDDLDEVDWEWLGGAADEVQTNYFGKGNTTSYDRGGKSAVSDSQGTTHNYTLDWTPDAITWYIDGVAVRTLAYADALGGKNFPQTPMRLKLGSWAGGDSDNAQGTIEWAGGETNYDDGPFTMYVESVKITNTYPGSSYTYGDQTGDWTSIVVDSSSSSSSGASSSGKNSTSTTTSSAKESSTAATNSSTTVKSSSTSTSAAATSSVTSVTAGSGTSPVTVNPFFVAIAGLTAFLLL